MTSMFDQYNTALKREENPSNQLLNAAMSSSGYVSVRTKQETPIFVKTQINITLPKDISFMRVANNWLFVLMSNNTLLRLNLVDPTMQNEVYLEKYPGLRVSNLFVDPTGNHLFIALTTTVSGIVPELLYLHRKSHKPKKVEKFRDHEITAVAFNHLNKSESSTGSILIGTSKGLIFETELGMEGEKMFQSCWKQVFDIGKGEHCPITGIEWYKVAKSNRYIVMVTTLNRLYKFHEALRVDEKPPYLQNIFNSYLNVPEDIKDFHEVSSKLKYSKLSMAIDKGSSFPKRFGWLTEIGIYTGEIDQQAESPQFLRSEELVPYPTNDEEDSITSTPSDSYNASKIHKPSCPISFVLTEFHAILLYTDHITVLSLLNYQIVYEEHLIPGRFIDITRDAKANTILLFTSRSIFRFKVTNEQRHVWALYLEKNEFDQAKTYCNGNLANLNVVLIKQAEMMFNQKRYLDCAQIYSETQASFEDVCLKFMDINEYDALLMYLNSRLEKLSDTDKTQTTMLVVWIVELYLTLMARCSATGQQSKNRTYQMGLDAFMKNPKVIECVSISNRTVIYDLMASHGDNFNLSTLTQANADYESVLDQYINQGKYKDAVKLLIEQKKPQLFYKYCPMLMEEIPSGTIDAIIGQGPRLAPLNLLPTLICQDSEEQRNEIVRYLEYCTTVLGCREQALHNFLLKLYAQRGDHKLMSYLELQGEDISDVPYDVHYALRICGEYKADRACVFLQCLLEIWHPAVELALNFDSKLAQQTASRPNDIEQQRKLWLLIAERELTGKNDVERALELLRECRLLHIEDLLPFFGDFQKIDDFKEVICDALKEYNAKIDEQSTKMKKSAESAEKVRGDLQKFRNRSFVINGDDTCSICSELLMTRPFFIFPCGHKFHNDCLEHQITEYLSTNERHHLTSLKQQLQLAGTAKNPTDKSTNDGPSQRNRIKEEIEAILAADCLFCGERMINNIDKPFIDDWKRVNLDWQ